MKSIYCVLVLIALNSCKKESSQNKADTQISNSKQKKDTALAPAQVAEGIVMYDSIDDLDTAYANLKAIFNKNSSIDIMAELDHSEHAEKTGIDLPSTYAIFFGNPNLGTPLMQSNPLIGLDLPQKIIYAQDSTGINQIMYNDVEYLNQRYALENHKNLSVISNTLKALVEKTSGRQTSQTTVSEVLKHQGIITKTSKYDFSSTLDRMLTILNTHENLKIIAQIDHQSNAKKAGLELAPVYLIIFGNPEIGSPLMKSQQSIALDLPQKMLIWEDKSGQAYVSYNDMNFLKNRHHLEGHDSKIKKINAVLDVISSKAIE